MTKRHVLSISVDRAGKEITSLTFPPSNKYITIGDAPDDDISINLPGILDHHKLVEKRWNGHRLIIPKHLEGDVTVGLTKVPVKGLADSGLLREKTKKNYILPIPEDPPCQLKIGDVTISFSYVEKARKPVKKADAVLKKRLIGREDFMFLKILLIASVIGFSVAGLLQTVEIKKKEHTDVLKALPTRFAKLIFKPAEKKVVTASLKPKAEEKEKEDQPQKKEEETKKKEARVEKAVSAGAAVDAGDKGSGVKAKGLLGLITAKSKPAFLSDDIFDTGDMPSPGGKSAGFSSIGDVGGIGGKDTLADLGIKELEKDVAAPAAPSGAAHKKKSAAEILKDKKEVALLETQEKEKTSDSGSGRKRSEAEVARTVSSYVGGLKYLYNNALRKDPALKGKITVKLVISPEGKVTNAEKVSSTLNSGELEDALINRIYKWKFPDESGAEEFIISYTFDFSPTS